MRATRSSPNGLRWLSRCMTAGCCLSGCKQACPLVGTIIFRKLSIYYAEHGDSNIPKRYTTPAGLSLGEWLTTQRRVRAGQIWEPDRATGCTAGQYRDGVGQPQRCRMGARPGRKRENFGNSLGICRSRRNTKRKMTILWESGSTMRGNAEAMESCRKSASDSWIRWE